MHDGCFEGGSGRFVDSNSVVIESPGAVYQDDSHAPNDPSQSFRLELDMAANRVYANGVLVELGPIQFRMLHLFMGHTEQVYSRTQLLDQVWERKVCVVERTVDVHVQRLRAALKPFGMNGLVQTVRGRGYRFSCRY